MRITIRLFTVLFLLLLLAPAVRSDPSPAETLWHDRLLAGMDASRTLIDDAMKSGDSYTIGRTGGNYVEALLMAWRATGDRILLDRVLELTELARARLCDAWLDGTTDGFTDWNTLVDSTDVTHYGKDTNWLDESIASGNVALWTYAFNANRYVDPAYAAAADFWRDWLEKQFLAKWYRRAGGDPLVAWNTPYAAFYKPDTEPRSANWRLAHYLWRVTGNPFYQARAEEIQAQLLAAQQLNPVHPQAYRWARQLDPATQDWQTINYANYYMRVVLEMNLEGVPGFASAAEMEHFAATFRDVVYAGSLPDLATMSADVDGTGSAGYALHCFNGFAAWDSTGFLMDLADRSITGAGGYAGGGLSKAARNDVYICAYSLMALGPAAAAGVAVPPGGLAPGGTGARHDPMGPTGIVLVQNEPNPFESSTVIRFEQRRAARVRLAIYDAGGRLLRVLRDEATAAGRHAVSWDGRDGRGAPVPAGVYYVAAEKGGRRVTRRATRLR